MKIFFGIFIGIIIGGVLHVSRLEDFDVSKRLVPYQIDINKVIDINGGIATFDTIYHYKLRE